VQQEVLWPHGHAGKHLTHRCVGACLFLCVCAPVCGHLVDACSRKCYGLMGTRVSILHTDVWVRVCLCVCVCGCLFVGTWWMRAAGSAMASWARG